MAPHFLLPLAFFIALPFANAGDWPPFPGFSPSSRFRSMSFYTGFRNLWGASHQSVDGNGIAIWLDKESGSGFKSLKPFRSGYFGASIKLQPGYTAGVITAFYLSNNQAHPGYHDEVDIEFLGTTFGKPYTLQTNVYIRGSGDGRIIGREMKFHLWFDPTQDFHHYAILWSPKEIIFFIDDVPIRRYPRKSDATFPLRPMWVYGSIWDASSWATEDGKYKADYSYQPFIGRFTDFKVSGCTAFAPSWCHLVSASPFPSGGLTGQQSRAMQWVQSRYLVYDYCKDNKRDHSLTPECWN
ncbi:Xyloglucan endotransglucosylase/hydrolase protein 14 precursor [Dorcoceras hygrometricum]|uniref:Xyloglucan endotransglucosylase/hydrolase n=1 Tax=Dorcoceras hygrometricum TaxID=472368 RepID=A0A2Z7DKA6_9LAMI|nr:Xyloglucan endotransglucosylase/hydrolase protein 14 precursor [Dorcoceras hygrometricum]